MHEAEGFLMRCTVNVTSMLTPVNSGTLSRSWASLQQKGRYLQIDVTLTVPFLLIPRELPRSRDH